MTAPLVSVVMAVHNRERFVRGSVESVLGQTMKDFELIVVDDGSSDGSCRILEEYGERIRLLRRTSNSGRPAVPRNEAMRAARGRYIAFLDSDDLWYPSKLESQCRHMESRSDSLLSHSFCHVIDEDGNRLRVRREEDMPTCEDAIAVLVRESFITTSTAMVRRDVFEKIGGFNECRELRCGEDREWFLRVASLGPITFIPEVLGAYRRSSDNILGDDWRLQKNVLNTQKWILRHPSLWEHKVNRRDVAGALEDKCVEYAHYWQARGLNKCALSMVALGLMRIPGSTKLWRRAACSAARVVMPGRSAAL